jgi:uncharacterized membrane protein YbhN (UPF0104 family)
MDFPAQISRLSALLTPLQARLTRWRRPIVAAALLLFLGGTIWSFLGLGLSLAQLDFVALAVLTLGMGLVMLAYSALSLTLMARTVGVEITFKAALQASTRAQLAEALPLPGGAIVRTAALVSAGATTTISATLVIGSALLWIALAAIAAGMILTASAPLAGWILIGSGAVIALAALFQVVRLGGPANAALTLLHRLAGLGIAAVRLWLAFAVVKASIPLTEIFPYVLAAIAGSASSLVPGGLGVSEALGALMAQAVHSAPQAAFLALAINRVTQFLGTAIIAPFLEFGAPRASLTER